MASTNCGSSWIKGVLPFLGFLSDPSGTDPAMVFLRIYIETWNLPAPYSSSLVLWWVGRCPLCHHIASEKQKLNLLLSYLAALHLAFLMLPITKQEKAMTRSQIKHRFLFQYVLNIMTACRMLQISIAQCQIEAEIHSFPTMYGKGGYMWQKLVK